MSNEKFEPPHTANKSFSPKLVSTNNSTIRLELKGSCLKQEDKAAYTTRNVVNFLIIYELDSWSQNFDIDFTLSGSLFRGVRLSNNSDPDKYPYSAYGIGSMLGENILYLTVA